MLKKFGVGAGVSVLPVAFSRKTRAHEEQVIPILFTVNHYEHYDGGNTCCEHPTRDEISGRSLAGSMTLLWEDEVGDGEYLMDFDGRHSESLPESAFDSDDLGTRAVDADHYLQDNSARYNYDSWPFIIVLDYNFKNDTSTYGDAMSWHNKTAVVDTAFFDKPGDTPFEPDGFYGETGIRGTVFRAIADGFASCSVTDATTNSSGDFSLIAREESKAIAGCGNTSGDGDQALFVSQCTRDQIQSTIDRN